MAANELLENAQKSTLTASLQMNSYVSHLEGRIRGK